ncbi:MAG: endolytic transglycosylase MltG, partial [Patescibacteria group bacterium]
LLSGVDERARRITLIEGWTLDEYAGRLDENGFSPEVFLALTRDLPLWRDSYDFLTSVPSGQSLEGYLFPDTYSIDAAKDAEQLMRKMLDNFSEKLTPELRKQVAGSGRTLHEVITLASIIEREVAKPEDRRLVADIFLKRLRDGIGLQSDATVNYITKSGRTRSTAADLDIDSPYNTYKYRGLPPGPIGNPGIDAITAALDPQPNDYYYFLTDTDGGVHYARTFDEHQKNRELYL